jgi:hypothetical protein
MSAFAAQRILHLSIVTLPSPGVLVTSAHLASLRLSYTAAPDEPVGLNLATKSKLHSGYMC